MTGPRIVCEAGSERDFVDCVNDVQRLPAVIQWAAEQDEPVGDQAVHELGMLVPAVLLADPA